ncbi:hypothetical protein TIFTF001_010282 [Ficus carica]|uniref:Phytocyanin domain-containing protein n=1 Tax=Ficus carica TaxID=3494 RepID=A0AA88D4D4_FICCA|nr:hypothetical protein TIFTF001_010282 [Ficus carica]
MENLLQVYAFLALSSAITYCGATTYTVGDNSGWDISTNLETWPTGKIFNVGDILVFQYSSSHGVSEVTRKSFDSCNTTNVLDAFSNNGNTTVALTKPGERYFVCGNKLHCLGGMKLQVKVESNQDYAPTGAPLPTTGSNQDLSKNDNIPRTSSSFSHIGGTNTFVLACLISLVVFITTLDVHESYYL